MDTQEPGIEEFLKMLRMEYWSDDSVRKVFCTACGSLLWEARSPWQYTTEADFSGWLIHFNLNHGFGLVPRRK